jgi:hypothetical protein
MILAISGEGDIEQIPVSGDLSGSWVGALLHVTDSPRFFVLSGIMVYRIDKNGASERLFKAEALSLWKDKLLLFDKSGMTLYRIGSPGESKKKPASGGQGRFLKKLPLDPAKTFNKTNQDENLRKKTIVSPISINKGLTLIYKRKGKIKKIKRHRGSYESRLVLFEEGREFFMLDLEKEEDPVKVDIKRAPFYYLVFGDKYILLHRKPYQVFISQLKAGKIVDKKTWEPVIEYKYEAMCVSAYGVLVYNEQEYEVYPFFRK